MKRILINQIEKNEGKRIMIKGRILNMRNLGNVVFLIVQDYMGTIQAVFNKSAEAKVGDSVAIEGIVKKEPRSKYSFEIQGEKIEVVSATVEDSPFDLAKNDLNLNLPTLLDYRPLSLRHPKVQAIFKLYDIFLKGYETVMREEGFTEVKTPKILGAATEGGANFFKVKYFSK